MHKEVIKIGKRGTIIIPISFRNKFGLNEGDIFIAEDREEGVLLKPAITLPIEIYSKEKKAEFLLSNSIDKEDYENARKEVIKMGINPETISHFKPNA